MGKPFFDRLQKYFLDVGRVLRGQANVAAVFPNSSDIGNSREQIYGSFLKEHLPSSCVVVYGGFLFNLNGDESKQIDIIITNDVSPQYVFNSQCGQAKTFRCIEGCIAVASIKSNLNTHELFDSLENIASLPDKQPLGNRGNPMIDLSDYEDWPFKIIYASDGISLANLYSKIDTFYKKKPHISYFNRPNLIHVAGKYNLIRTPPEGSKTRSGKTVPGNIFFPNDKHPDVLALPYTVQKIQLHAMKSQHILFNYGDLLNSLLLEKT